MRHVLLTCGLATLFLLVMPAAAAVADVPPDPNGTEEAAARFEEALRNISRPVSLGVVQEPTADPTALPRPRAGRFGEQGTWRLNFGVGAGFAARSAQFQQGYAAFSYFIIEDLSIDFQGAIMHFDQRGPNAWGAAFTLLVRWHIISEPTWSFYLDGGSGILLSTERVPRSGTRFNFTPQAGAGVSFDIGGDWRMMLGARWHHISNADLGRDNPGRDSAQVYLGFSIPF